MTKEKKTLAQKIVTACASNKTKAAIADKIGASYSTVSRIVNCLVADGTLVAAPGKKPVTGRTPVVYKRAS
jgi:predicted ArsR family transcriptional regulator